MFKWNKFFLAVMLAQSTFLYPACVTGSLQQVPRSPFDAEVLPQGIAFSPVVAGNLFVADVNAADDNTSVYLVNQSTGTLTQISGSPFATGDFPDSIAYSPVVSGNLFVAIANGGDNTVSVYLVNQSTGAFTEIAGSPFATGIFPVSIAFSPVVSGNLFAAIVNASDSTVSVYSVNQSTGVFTEIAGSPFPTGVAGSSVAFSLISGVLYAAVANFFDNTVSVYSVNQATGAFTEIAGSPFATGLAANIVAYSPAISGNIFAAVTNFFGNSVSVYLVNQTTGAFNEVAGSPFATGGNPVTVAFTVISGSLFAAVTNSADDNVSIYSVNSTTGAFMPISGSPFAAGDAPSFLAFSPLLSNGNQFAALVNTFGDNISVYKICMAGNVTACTLKNIFLVQTELVNVIRWQAPAGVTPATYRIYRDQSLTQLAGQVTAPCTQFLDHSRNSGVTYSYFIVSVDAAGNQSVIGNISITT